MKGNSMSALRGLLAIGFMVSLSLFVAGCVPSEADGDTTSARETIIQKSESGGRIPDGAVPLSDNIYAVPVAVDSEGCELFAEWTAGGVVRQVIYFRDGEGEFSAVKSDEHACNAVMVDVGGDERGCTIYRAEQPDGSASDVAYYRSATGYTVNPDNADCSE